MRCEYCGWDNPSTNKVCEKCGLELNKEYANSPAPQQPLPSQRATNLEGRPTERRSDFNPKKTVRERAGVDGKADALSTNECVKCGYEMADEDTHCPCCGYEREASQSVSEKVGPKSDASEFQGEKDSPSMPDYKKTILPNRKGGKKSAKLAFTLSPIPENGENIDEKTLEFNASETTLNRANTEPGNCTITSGEQAVIFNREGKWYVIDKSDMRTTFVQANDEIEIKDGSLIILGDRVFRFGC